MAHRYILCRTASRSLLGAKPDIEWQAGAAGSVENVVCLTTSRLECFHRCAIFESGVTFVHCGLMLGIAVLAAHVAAGSRNCADARSLAEVRQTGILRLCANPSALPYSNLTDRGGLAGFEVELAEALAHEMALELGVTWVRNAANLKNSDCDLSMGV